MIQWREDDTSIVRTAKAPFSVFKLEKQSRSSGSGDLKQVMTRDESFLLCQRFAKSEGGGKWEIAVLGPS